MKNTLLTLATFFFILAGTGEAKSLTGNDLLEKCKNVGNGNFESGICGGYVDGVIDGVFYMAVQKAKSTADVKQPFCIPNEVTNGQIVAVLMKYLNDHPEELHRPAAVLLVESLSKAFPCH